MSLTYALIARFEDLRSIAFGSILTTYVQVGLPTENTIRMVCFNNTTNANLIISFNGINDKVFVAANGFKLYDFASNKSNQGGTLDLPQNTAFWVRLETGSTATSGNLYIETCYGATA
jgi:hypothetical protein